ncbi:regulatory protein RecX [Aurantimonas sp. VKM B-3413]|uniref:regulatory protein RecX n=1 Tax=Aurantimonas sp. VKM B-3413 TaxID=2779401 RepID=UPI001E644C67|nr:RecX family transcriptional regulator [Aurantimonas sp. VKM B-3413]MCB8840051.1 RecX family transcriptional regulator [Aurantimonas sp. VKM B-3413]
MARDDSPPKPIDAGWLMRSAAHYLERYASSTENLRRVLERKVMRRAAARGESPEGHEPLIAATVDRFVELGLLDDRSFAEARMASLRRRGTSRVMTAAKLREKGVNAETVAAVLSGDETDEAAAARAYARRRRLGPWRLRERSERRERDIAAMIRAGYAYGLAATVIDGQTDEAAEAGEGL